MVRSGQKLEEGRNRSHDISIDFKFYSDFKNDNKNDLTRSDGVKQGHMRSNKVRNKILGEIGHVTYQSIQNFILFSKMIIKMIEQGHVCAKRSKMKNIDSR